MRVYSPARRRVASIGRAAFGSRGVALPESARKRGTAARLGAWLAALALLWAPEPVHAEPAAVADSAAKVVAVQAGPGARSSLAPALSARFPAVELVFDLRVWLEQASQGVDPGALSALSQLEDELTLARRAAAELDERASLLRLAHAETLVRRALAVPGAAAFYAEVEVQLGITAAQAGLPGLASASLRRAAHFDARRKLLAGEASPELVSLASRLWNEAESAPEGELSLAVDAAHARVFLDDVDRGEAPLRVHASCGEHVLRIEAPEHLTYGAVVVVEQGQRPIVQIALAPDPVFAQLARLERAAAASDFAHLPAALAAFARLLPELSQLVVIESVGDRALLVPCAALGCTAPERVLAGRIIPASSVGSLSMEALDDARAWLHGDGAVTSVPAARASAPPIWKRWYAWSALAVLVGAAGSLVAASVAPAPQRELHLVVDPKGVQ